MTGRFLLKGQKDHFAVTAKKGQRLRIAAQTAEVRSPAEIYITVRDGAGAELAHTDPRRDPVIDFTAPADGNFYIVAEHLNYMFGPCEVYRLTVTAPVPGFEVGLATDRVAVPQGQIGLIPVATLIRHDFGGPIRLERGRTARPVRGGDGPGRRAGRAAGAGPAAGAAGRAATDPRRPRSRARSVRDQGAGPGEGRR